MPFEVAIRRPRPHEYDSLRQIIEIVATETFKELFAPNPVPLDFKDEDWPRAWVAVSDAKILGVIITNQEWIDDLWVLQEYRQRGVGRKLLSHGESEIAARGYQTCRLRVVSRIWLQYSSTIVRGGGSRVSSPTRNTSTPC